MNSRGAKNLVQERPIGFEDLAGGRRKSIRLESRRCRAQRAARSPRPSGEAHEKNWLHVLCSTTLKGRRPAASIKTADVLLARGIDLHAHACTEPNWKGTPVWWRVAWGRNVVLAEHLLKRGATTDYSMFAASRGGLLELRKVAAMAEGMNLRVSPHGPASPVGNIAAGHACVTLPNCEINEFAYAEVPWRGDLHHAQ